VKREKGERKRETEARETERERREKERESEEEIDNGTQNQEQVISSLSLTTGFTSERSHADAPGKRYCSGHRSAFCNAATSDTDHDMPARNDSS